MFKRLVASLLLLWPLGAAAQTVQQSGTVTNGHAATWVAPGVIKDAGTASTGALNTLGVTSDSSCSLGTKSTAGDRLCLGVTPTQAIISLSGSGGLPLIVDVYGTQYEFPVSSGTVTSVNADTSLSGLTFSGGPITTSGTLSLTGTLGLPSGGTGATTQTSAANAVLPPQGGNTGLFLRTDGTNVLWDAGAGGVSSVGLSGGTTGLTVSGSPVTGSGTMTIAGTLSAANGGTGRTTLTAHGLLVGNGTEAVSVTSSGSSGECLTSNGASADPTFQPCVGGGTVTSVATGVGLTGGPITSSGTVSFASVANGSILANVAGTSTPAVANTLTTILDATLTSTQGVIIYRGASAWTILTPGTNGQVLTTSGAAANPTWETIASGGSAPIMQVFTASGTWTKTGGLTAIIVEVVGGGGGGSQSGGMAGQGAGGGGAYGRRLINAADLASTETITIGAGGAAGNPGSTGGTSSFGSLCSSTGGAGGTTATGGAGGTSSCSGGIPVTGGGGGYSTTDQAPGGSSVLGGGAPGKGNAASAVAGGNYGGGGQGGRSDNGANAGAGASGVIIVTEYY